jgi:hypothetical protein
MICLECTLFDAFSKKSNLTHFLAWQLVPLLSAMMHLVHRLFVSCTSNFWMIILTQIILMCKMCYSSDFSSTLQPIIGETENEAPPVNVTPQNSSRYAINCIFLINGKLFCNISNGMHMSNGMHLVNKSKNANVIRLGRLINFLKKKLTGELWTSFVWICLFT